MSYILTYVRVALATSDVQSILEIPATDEIHLEDRNQTCVSTATVESCGTKTTNGRINLCIKLEKHKVDQMAEKKHYNFTRQAYSFLEVKLRRL